MCSLIHIASCDVHWSTKQWLCTKMHEVVTLDITYLFNQIHHLFLSLLPKSNHRQISKATFKLQVLMLNYYKIMRILIQSRNLTFFPLTNSIKGVCHACFVHLILLHPTSSGAEL